MSAEASSAPPMSRVAGDAPALTVRSVAIDDPGPLLGLLPAGSPLAWVREGEGIVGWGEAARLQISGAQRFAQARHWWADATARSTVIDEVALPGTGLIAFGAFEFSDASDVGSGAADGTVRPSTLIVPAVAVGRRGDRWWITTASAGDAPPPPMGRLPLDQPPRSGGQSDVGPMVWSDAACTGDQWMAVVAQALRLIESGRLSKVVLARDRVARAAAPIDPRAPLRRLGADYPSCWTFAVDGLIGATPEMLVRLHDGVAQSRVLAGTIRRGGRSDLEDLAVQLAGSAKDRREHEFSVRSVVDALRPHCLALDVPEAPFVLRLPNVLHLASDISGVVADGSSALDLAEALHPTAAVCGSPMTRALSAIGDLEPMTRARYAGPVGWISADGDGEWGIALRCGQIDAHDARRIRIFAGAGIVAESDPTAELAETDAKFAPMIAALDAAAEA